MNRTIAIAGLSAFAILAAALLLYVRDASNGAQDAFITPSDQATVAQGKAVYDRHCAACHGANLEGHPEWRKRLPNGRLPAPPHDESGHTWHHADALLIDIVKNGLVPGRTAPDGYESDMPGFGKVLADADVVAVLAYIKSRWPAEALEAQKNVTLQSSRR